jgi:hypothetical protein
MRRAVFQFFDPLNGRNSPTPLARQGSCPICGPATPTRRVWRKRYTVWPGGGIRKAPPALRFATTCGIA